MQTSFTAEQLADPDVAESETILRKCVHCGFCTATCPTYVLLGDELDSPRGRIYLIKGMLEQGEPATPEVVKHVDRCLSCLSCMTTCPSGVHYQHLVDHARHHIAETYVRPWPERAVRRLLAFLLPRPIPLRFAMAAAKVARPFRNLFPRILRPMLDLAPRRIFGPSWADRPGAFPAEGARRMRVALLTGCAQQALAPAINEATVRLLTRHGIEVVVAPTGCCGALVHHMGQTEPALAAARANVDAWWREVEGEGLDAIVANASGCGTQLKDYGFMLRNDPAYADKAARVSALAKDVSEVMAAAGVAAPVRATGQTVAYHSACSLQHGQKVRTAPKDLLAKAGFTVKEPAEAHLCCGSAGTYNLLQPEIAGRLKDRKVANIERTRPDVIAAGNIGCMTQIASGTGVPVVHTVELLDWATGGPLPDALKETAAFARNDGVTAP
jgi:glycolate oxidase iron-sulfur subunit